MSGMSPASSSCSSGSGHVGGSTHYIAVVLMDRYKLAINLNVTSAPSVYPLAHTSVLPFLALPPAELRKRAYNVTRQHGVFGMAFPSGEGSGQVNGEADVILSGLDNTVELKTLHQYVRVILPARRLS